ncbi:MAG: permease-like cell division protein FtsX [Candidatus Gracilibacteria bacterium]
MFHGMILVHENAKNTLKNIQQKFSITVYLKDDADPFEVGNTITSLEDRSDIVSPVTYTSKEAAWEMMSKTFSLDNELLKKYKFSLPASLTITPKNPSDVPQIEAFLQTNAANILKDSATMQDKQKNITNQIVEFVQSVEKTTQSTLIFFIILFVLGGALLLSSTIHLAITSRHTEINIMKLVGSSHSTIILPFVIEGLLVSIIAFLVNLVILALLPISIINVKLHLNALLFEFIATILLGVIVSYLTTLFHIRKKTFF